MARYGFSPTGNPLTGYVNMHQTPQERRDKYHHCRLADLNPSWSQALRDWRWKRIFQFLDAEKQRETTTATTAFNS